MATSAVRYGRDLGELQGRYRGRWLRTRCGTLTFTLALTLTLSLTEDGYERGVTPAPPGPPAPLPEISFGRPLEPERFEYLKPSSPRPNGQQVNLLRRPLSPGARPSRPKSASPGEPSPSPSPYLRPNLSPNPKE